MENINVYEDIAKRTDGDIYVGVVGPVRTGKSTFIKNFMDLLVIPNIENEYKKERATDELPQSASGRTIMTTEPKFVPNEAVEITIGDNIKLRTRLVDCVGYLVNNAIGYLEDDMPRMVKTPWSDKEMPFEQAAEIGTKKVIEEHSTIGIVMTTDGSFTDIPREDYVNAEERVVNELKSLNKPFVIVLNSENPNSEYTKELARKGEELYMVEISDDVNMINIDADEIKPLAEEFTGLENFFVLKNGNNVAIVKYEDDQLVRLGAVDGTGIKIGTPFFDFSESAIKIPLKVTVEKNLTE